MEMFPGKYRPTRFEAVKKVMIIQPVADAFIVSIP